LKGTFIPLLVLFYFILLKKPKEQRSITEANFI